MSLIDYDLMSIGIAMIVSLALMIYVMWGFRKWMEEPEDEEHFDYFAERIIETTARMLEEQEKEKGHDGSGKGDA